MTRSTTALLAMLLAGFVSTASAANKLERRIESATEVLQQFTRIPEQGIPPTLLRNAYGIAVIPNVIKAGFMLGGAYGQGILVKRQPDGSWSNPSFITIGAGSGGFQIGAQSSDIILVFKTRRGIENIEKGRFTLGGDAAVAAGPVGRYASAATDLGLKAEIYTYARTRGLFGGVSIEGTWIAMDQKSNFAFYETGQGTAASILNDEQIPTPATARRFIETLAAATPNLGPQSETTRQARADTPAPEGSGSGGAKTFAIDDAPAAGDSIF